jgi:hypothetical protein
MPRLKESRQREFSALFLLLRPGRKPRNIPIARPVIMIALVLCAVFVPVAFMSGVTGQLLVSGAYQNVLSGENSPISGQIDKKIQRVAWKIGTNNTVIETGLHNLSQDVASCLVHFGPDKTQTWLLVRQKQPEMPNASQTAEAETKGS